MLLIDPAWYDWFWLVPFLAFLVFAGIGLLTIPLLALYLSFVLYIYPPLRGVWIAASRIRRVMRSG